MKTFATNPRATVARFRARPAALPPSGRRDRPKAPRLSDRRARCPRTA
jgi:hypothetical protein